MGHKMDSKPKEKRYMLADDKGLYLEILRILPTNPTTQRLDGFAFSLFISARCPVDFSSLLDRIS